MDFEKTLKDRIRNEVKRNLNRFPPFFNRGNTISNTTKEVFENFRDIIDIYNLRKYKNKEAVDKILDMGDEFEQYLTDNYLGEMYEKAEFSDEELLYIQYVQLSNKWRGHSSFDIDKQYAIVDILLKRIIIQEFGEDSIDIFVKIMEDEKDRPKMKSTCTHFLQLFSEKPYGTTLQQDFESELEEKADYLFNYKINCGGYALEIDTCIFPFSCKDFSQSVSTILDKFPFVRLLGDKKLKDDEYLVIYRSNSKNTGHHFIKIEDDGTVKEKNGPEAPKEFNGWENLENCEEAIFAVKKEHKMFGYDLMEVNCEDKKGLNFEETITQAISNRTNTFYYHGHKYSLKKSSDEEIFIESDGIIIAHVLTDGKECIAEIREGKEAYVENFSGNVTPIIENGHLINRGEFIENKSHTDCDERN